MAENFSKEELESRVKYWKVYKGLFSKILMAAGLSIVFFPARNWINNFHAPEIKRNYDEANELLRMLEQEGRYLGKKETKDYLDKASENLRKEIRIMETNPELIQILNRNGNETLTLLSSAFLIFGYMGAEYSRKKEQEYQNILKQRE